MDQPTDGPTDKAGYSRVHVTKNWAIFLVFWKIWKELKMKIEKCSQSLVRAYPEDLEDHLSEELIQFSAHLKTDLGDCMDKKMDKKMNKEVQMYKLI